MERWHDEPYLYQCHHPPPTATGGFNISIPSGYPIDFAAGEYGVTVTITKTSDRPNSNGSVSRLMQQTIATVMPGLRYHQRSKRGLYRHRRDFHDCLRHRFHSQSFFMPGSIAANGNVLTGLDHRQRQLPFSVSVTDPGYALGWFVQPDGDHRRSLRGATNTVFLNATINGMNGSASNILPNSQHKLPRRGAIATFTDSASDSGTVSHYAVMNWKDNTDPPPRRVSGPDANGLYHRDNHRQ